MFVVHLLNWIGGLGWGVGGSFIWREWERAMNMIDNSLYIFEQPNKKRPVLTLVSSRFRNLCKQRGKVMCKKKGRTAVDVDCGEGVGYSMRSKYSVLLSVSPMSYMLCK